jgi:hypothetical protein
MGIIHLFSFSDEEFAVQDMAVMKFFTLLLIGVQKCAEHPFIKPADLLSRF